MPSKPLKPCNYPGCGNLTHDRYCDKHKQQVVKQYDKQRGTAAQRGYGTKWQRYRKQFLLQHPLCAECERHGKITAATIVDHIKPHKGDPFLFWLPSNHQSLCKRCHDIKTATEDGGFGKPVKG